MQQATDFLNECEALYQLLAPLKDEAFDQPTQFKGWTINNVLGHLHLWNYAADLSLQSAEEFQSFFADLVQKIQTSSMNEAEAEWVGGIKGQQLLDTWVEFYAGMSQRFKQADPRMRLKWAGPDMSAKSSITARLMETWAHGQEVYDSLGVVRKNTDGIKNIVVLGMNTFGWTYVNRGMEVPALKPFLRLVAPSGEIWELGEESETNCVEGDAEEFCQVVTQVRNIADTSLRVRGDVALEWMAMAQCFAGGPEDPPEPGVRFTHS